MLGAFRRAIEIKPEPHRVTVWVEDDMHHMCVVLQHDGRSITAAAGMIMRAPWSTCPGAPAMLSRTFAGVALAQAAQIGGKKQNCTHLFDLAVLAAAHAGDADSIRYDLTVTDPLDGIRFLSGARNGEVLMRWTEQERVYTAPGAIAGRTIFELSGWIAGLERPDAEMARLLRTAAIVSHGRSIPMEEQSDASRIPPNCFTFQPGRRELAERQYDLRDFTRAMDALLSGR